MRTCSPVLFACVIASCGGRVAGDSDPGDSGASPDVPVVVDAPRGEGGVACVLDDGTPVCGWPGCSQSCDTCQLFLTRDVDGVIPASICPEDDARVFSRATSPFAPCSACPNDDDVCALTTDYQCVHPSICVWWHSVGYAGCWFRDMTPWVPTPIPDAPCPGTGFCGGTCGNCAVGESCTGRSQVHPIGVCAAVSLHFYNNCRHSLDVPGAFGCPAPGMDPADDTCLVFKDPDPADQAAEDAGHGVCVPRDRCLTARASLPGGVFCVDASGHEI